MAERGSAWQCRSYRVASELVWSCDHAVFSTTIARNSPSARSAPSCTIKSGCCARHRKSLACVLSPENPSAEMLLARHRARRAAHRHQPSRHRHNKVGAAAKLIDDERSRRRWIKFGMAASAIPLLALCILCTKNR